MKILSSAQIRDVDNFTIGNEPIKSIDLMERAASAFTKKFLELVPNKKKTLFFSGIGNNGGDALAIARMLKEQGWEIITYVVGNVEKGSSDFKANLERLSNYHLINTNSDFPSIDSECVIVDGIFGSGLSRPPEGIYAELIESLNVSKALKISIDIASGLFADKPPMQTEGIFRPDYTVAFQVPKLAFFQPELGQFVGDWHLVGIGLNEQFIQEQSTNYFFSEPGDLRQLIPNRSLFDHKGIAGRLLLVTGSKGKIGASILSARAALRTGVGLLTVHVPKCGTGVLQVAVPEAMVEEDAGDDQTESLKDFNGTIGIGPGIGMHEKTADAIEKLLITHKTPVVFDADAINILALRKHLLERLPPESILTPHPGEFMRLIGEWKDDFDKLTKLASLSKEYQLNIVLKGAYSAVCNSSGEIYFNPTGNPGMATAGSGDVLTGMVSSLLAQGLKPFDALRLGVYLHGLSGDIAASHVGENSLVASDIISNISNSFC